MVLGDIAKKALNNTMVVSKRENKLGMSSGRLKTILSENQIESKGTSSNLSTLRAIHDKIIDLEHVKAKPTSIELKKEAVDYRNSVQSFINSLPQSPQKILENNNVLRSPLKKQR